MNRFDQSADKALSRFAKDSRMRRSEEPARGKSTKAPAGKTASKSTDSDKQSRSPRRSFNPNFTEDNQPKHPTGTHGTQRRDFGHGREEGHANAERRRTSSFHKSDDRHGFTPKAREEGRGSRPAARHSKPADGNDVRRPSTRRRTTTEGAEERMNERRTSTPRRESTEGRERRSSQGFRPKDGRGDSGKSPRGRYNGSEAKYGDARRSERREAPEEKPKSYPRYNPNRSQDEMRLNRFIAQSGMCSRREADEYIKAGLVKVNGETVTELGVKVRLTDEIRFSDEKVRAEKNVYILLNKPKGYVTTTEDEHADHTVMELVANACRERIYPVGRLDKDSLGLLLFTNDGDITRALTHPSYKKKKIYEVTLDKPLTRADFDRLAEGVELEDGMAFFDQIEYTDTTKQTVGAEIHSGRNRIVRRMFDALGYKVRKLDRVYYAGLTKKNLKRGAWRFLTDEEVARLKSGRYE